MGRGRNGETLVLADRLPGLTPAQVYADLDF
jgi:hypothetical protein